MEEIFIKIRLLRQPKQKLTNAAITGDWKVVYDAADAKEVTQLIVLDKNRVMINANKVSAFIDKSIKRAMAIKPRSNSSSPKISGRIQRHALWAGEIPEGHNVWLDVDFFKDGEAISCHIKDKLNESEEKVQVTNLAEIVVKIVNKIAYIVKSPIVDPKQSEMFAPIPHEKPTPPVTSPVTSPVPIPQQEKEQLDMFSKANRDYREEIRKAALKKKTS